MPEQEERAPRPLPGDGEGGAEGLGAVRSKDFSFLAKNLVFQGEKAQKCTRGRIFEGF